MKSKYQTVIDTCNPQTPFEIKQMVEAGKMVEAAKNPHLGRLSQITYTRYENRKHPDALKKFSMLHYFTS